MSSKFKSVQDRRQFGRRWSKVHAWIHVDGRPRIACVVRNFSEGGALLYCRDAGNLPLTFRLNIDVIDFEIGCRTRHRSDDSVGVCFMSSDMVHEIGPIWTIEDLMSRSVVLQHAERLAD